MGGIAGIIYPDVFQVKDLVFPMIETMVHGCIKNLGLFTHKNIQIGTCCAKVSPNKNQTIFASIVGNISNKDELAKKLRINSENEPGIIIKAYEKFGPSFFEKLSGDFAILILDTVKKKIILGRDPIGKKNLYWYQDQHHFIFASELKSILASRAVPQTPAIDALASYLYFGYIPQDMSPIAGVNKLLPAHYLQVNFDGSKSISSYWSYSSYFQETTKSSKKQIIKNLDHLLIKSVENSIPKNEDIACFLSGGIGSASIAYYLKELSAPGTLSTYSVGFQGENEREFQTAKEVAKRLNLPHECYTITQKTFIDDLVKVSWYLDEPQADPNIISAWKLAQLSKEKVHTAFSGMGSDELLAGHSRYTIEEQGNSFYRQLTQPAINALNRMLIPVFNKIYKPLAYQLVKESLTDPWQFDYLRHNAIFSEHELMEASSKLSGVFDPEVFLHKFHHLQRVNSKVASYLYFDVKTLLVDCYIHQFERLTSVNSINWKAPFLQKDLVEYIASLPEPNFLKEKQAGSYLKALMKGALPQSILDRPKRTRKNFLKSWIQNDEMTEIFRLLVHGTLVDNGLISKIWLMEQINILQTSQSAYRYLWSVLQLEIWFRLFINRSITPLPPNISVKELLNEPA